MPQYTCLLCTYTVLPYTCPLCLHTPHCHRHAYSLYTQWKHTLRLIKSGGFDQLLHMYYCIKCNSSWKSITSTRNSTWTFDILGSKFVSTPWHFRSHLLQSWYRGGQILGKLLSETSWDIQEPTGKSWDTQEQASPFKDTLGYTRSDLSSRCGKV